MTMFFPSFSSLILTGGKTLIFPLSSEFKCPLPGLEYFASNRPLSPSHKKIEKKTGSSHGLCLDDLDIKTLLRDGDDDPDEQQQQDDGGGGGGEKV